MMKWKEYFSIAARLWRARLNQAVHRNEVLMMWECDTEREERNKQSLVSVCAIVSAQHADHLILLVSGAKQTHQAMSLQTHKHTHTHTHTSEIQLSVVKLNRQEGLAECADTMLVLWHKQISWGSAPKQQSDQMRSMRLEWTQVEVWQEQEWYGSLFLMILHTIYDEQLFLSHLHKGFEPPYWQNGGPINQLVWLVGLRNMSISLSPLHMTVGFLDQKNSLLGRFLPIGNG